MIWTDFSDMRGNPRIQSTSLSNNRAIERQKQISTELHENNISLKDVVPCCTWL